MYTDCDYRHWNLKDSAADSKLKLLKDGEVFGEEKPGGEKRIHIGSSANKSNFDAFFFPNGEKTVLFEFSKSDLLLYLIDAKDEFMNPKQSYRLDISKLYDHLLKETMSIKDDTLYVRFETNIDRRYYLARPKRDEYYANYNYISQICLPYVTDIVFIRAIDENGKYHFFLKPKFINKTASKVTSPVDEENPYTGPTIQKIYYGCPGTGKSYKVKHDVIPSGVKYYTVTFYSDYYYSDFVGGIRPKRTNTGIEYIFQPGPFAIALKDSFTEPVYLIIEEINRGNAAAIFGDIFQLLDRKSGKSEYSITNHDLYKYLKDEGKVDLPEEDKVYLPNNLNIVCTMNTADQNVFVLDTAFKRRFKMEYVPIDFNAYYKDGVLQEGCKGYIEKCDIFTDKTFEADIEKVIPAHMYKQIKDKVKETGRNWPTFAAYVNAIIDEINSSEQKISEDKKLGPFFVDTDELDDIRSFVDKVIYYLKQDVFKYEDNILDESYETLYNKIVNKKYDLFRLFDSK